MVLPGFLHGSSMPSQKQKKSEKSIITENIVYFRKSVKHPENPPWKAARVKS